MKRPGGFHEDFGRHGDVQPGSVGSFAVVMAAALAVVAVVLRGQALAWLAAGLAVAVLAAWRLRPALLQPLNRAWFRLGMLLGRIVTPLVMGVVFFGVVTPIGLVRRLAGRDSLRLKPRAPGESYWVERRPPGPEPEQVSRQF